MAQAGRTIRLVSGGDVMFRDRLSAIPSVATGSVRAALAPMREADLCFMNCEMSLTSRGHPAEKLFNIRCDPELAHDLRSLGTHVVTLANNHMMDFGNEGLFDTLDAIDAAGMDRVGAGRNVEEALLPRYRVVDGKRFAFLGVACTLPPGCAAGPERPGVAPIRVAFSFEMDPILLEGPGAAPIVRTRALQPDVDRAIAAIAAARREADHVIVAIHWGVVAGRVPPIQGLIAEYQPPLGHAFIDAGADMVLGNHSHSLYGVEVYRGRPIFYSLGHLIFQRPYDFKQILNFMEPETALVQADFGESSLRVRLVPVLLNAEGFPETPCAADRDRIAALIADRSRQFGTRFTADGEAIEVQLEADR